MRLTKRGSKNILWPYWTNQWRRRVAGRPNLQESRRRCDCGRQGPCEWTSAGQGERLRPSNCDGDSARYQGSAHCLMCEQSGRSLRQSGWYRKSVFAPVPREIWDRSFLFCKTNWELKMENWELWYRAKRDDLINALCASHSFSIIHYQFSITAKE